MFTWYAILQTPPQNRNGHRWVGGNIAFSFLQLWIWQLIYRSSNAISLKQTYYVPRWHGTKRAQRQQRRRSHRTSRTTWTARYVKSPPASACLLKGLHPLSHFVEIQLFQQPNDGVLTSELSDLCMSALLTKMHRGIFKKFVGEPSLYLIFSEYF